MKRLITCLIAISVILTPIIVKAQTGPFVFITNGVAPPPPTFTLDWSMKVHLASQFGVNPSPNTNPVWNLAAPTAVTAGFYTSGNLVREDGVATTITFTNVSAWSGQTESNPVPATANTGIYPDVIVRSGWFDDGSVDMTFRFNGLDPTKIYHLWYLFNTDTWRGTTAYMYVGSNIGTTITPQGNFAMPAGGEYALPGTLGRVKNITPDGSNGITAGVHQIAGSGFHVGVVILQQSAMNNPN